jgi:hypothetical protein
MPEKKVEFITFEVTEEIDVCMSYSTRSSHHSFGKCSKCGGRMGRMEVGPSGVEEIYRCGNPVEYPLHEEAIYIDRAYNKLIQMINGKKLNECSMCGFQNSR